MMTREQEVQYTLDWLHAVASETAKRALKVAGQRGIVIPADYVIQRAWEDALAIWGEYGKATPPPHVQEVQQ
jgi:hypothetical protein